MTQADRREPRRTRRPPRSWRDESWRRFRAGLYAVRRRPVAMSRSDPYSSVRCSESRCGSRAAISARNGSARIDATSSSRRLRESRTNWRHVHFQRLGQPLERTERGNRLAVLDLGDVRPRDLHAAGQLTLAQVARLADVPYLCRYLQTQPQPKRHGGWAPVAAQARTAPRYRGAGDIFCKGNCWFCTAPGLQCSHRTTSRVSTLTRAVAMGCSRSARAGLRGAFRTVISANFEWDEP